MGDVGGVIGVMATNGDGWGKEPIAVGKRETRLEVERLGGVDNEVRGSFKGEGIELRTEFSE